MDDILNDLTIVDGKEKPLKKKVAKKPKLNNTLKKENPALEKTAGEKKSTKSLYSLEDLSKKSTSDLKNICKELNITVVRRKTDLIKNILNNS